MRLRAETKVLKTRSSLLSTTYGKSCGFGVLLQLRTPSMSKNISLIASNPYPVLKEMTARRGPSDCYPVPRFFGTFLPFLRALESAIAIACFRFLTRPPLPLFALPRL